MNKILVFFAMLFVFGTIISVSLEGAQPVLATTLSASVTDSSTVIPVTSITGFQDPSRIADLTSAEIVIGNETISYSETRTTPNCPAPFASAPACFIVASRGFIGDASQHDSGRLVQTAAGGYINQALDYKLIESADDDLGIGFFQIPNINPFALVGFLGKAIAWDYFFLDGNFAILRLPLMVLSIGFVWTLVAFMIPIAQGIRALIPGVNRL